MKALVITLLLPTLALADSAIDLVAETAVCVQATKHQTEAVETVLEILDMNVSVEDAHKLICAGLALPLIDAVQ